MIADIDWSAVPTFGESSRGTTTVPRPSAYALLCAPDGRIAVVRTPVGLYLPGGGVRDGESAEAAIHREIAEECGRAKFDVAALGTYDC